VSKRNSVRLLALAFSGWRKIGAAFNVKYREAGAKTSAAAGRSVAVKRKLVQRFGGGRAVAVASGCCDGEIKAAAVDAGED